MRIKVNDFMQKLDSRLWQLGVLSKTKHNEVAPAQHELAPLYSSCNTACDNNQLIMEIMRITAKNHGLACLLHEKPFDGINGSGKHNNWSLSTDDGVNLLNPGKNPVENLEFLLFLSATIKAIDEYADLIRLSAASAGNDHRLGGHEAPPAIISVFLGDAIDDVLKSVAYGTDNSSYNKDTLNTGAKVLPELKKDDSD
ncbi:MAG: glutamine synthetase type III, partial [Oscillospiraceae bacterium]